MRRPAGMSARARAADRGYGRRRFLRGLSALGAASLAAPYAGSLDAQPAFKTVRLSERMVAILGPGANALAADAGDGVALIDGGAAGWSEPLLQTVGEQFASKPVAALLNTHWHPEHTGSNAALGARGVPIIAHENTAGWLGTNIWVRWSGERYPPLPKSARPTTTFYDSGAQRVGDRELHCGYLPKSHTDGDVCVFFAEENVLVTGGTISNDGWPVLDWWTGGWTGGLLDALDSLAKIANAQTRIVPGNGPIMSYADLEAQRAMYNVIIERIHAGLRNALSTEELLASKPTAEYDARWGDPTQFVTLAFHSTWRHLRDSHDTRMNNIA
jgi:glyoxylase-like metal-dependent hydrolase (beta-lactamase superfamily II)